MLEVAGDEAICGVRSILCMFWVWDVVLSKQYNLDRSIINGIAPNSNFKVLIIATGHL